MWGEGNMAIKRQWQFGIIALAFTGVSTYNFIFFKDYSSSSPAGSPMETTAPLVAPSPFPQASADSFGQGSVGSLPPISMEELQQKSQYVFTQKESPEFETDTEAENRLPNRNPFSNYQEPKPVRLNATKPPPALKEIQPVLQTPPTINLPEPQCVFSGTLIDRERRLALVDGVPLSIGARIGAWQLARIESDYIILQSGDKNRRIELTNVGRQIAQKEPL
jgi:hypothetical protein